MYLHSSSRSFDSSSKNSLHIYTQASVALIQAAPIHYIPALKHWQSTFTIDSIGINSEAILTQAAANLILAATIHYVFALKHPQP